MEIKKPIYILLLLAVSLFVIFVFVIPKYQESASILAKAKETQATYDSRAGYSEQLHKAISEIESHPEALAKINSALPSDPSFGPIIYFLQKKGSESGLAVKSINFLGISQPAFGQTSQPQQGIKNISFTVVVSGQYRNVKKFLDSLDRSDRLFDVSNISFTSLQAVISKDLAQSYDFKIEVKTHSY